MVVDLFRPRRRRRLFLPIAVTVAAFGLIALSALVERGETPTLYVEDLRDAASAVGRKADTFQEVLGRLSGVSRVELEQVIGESRDAVAAARRFLSSTPAPPELTRATVIFDLALETWDGGLAGFEEALLGAADGEPTTVAREGLQWAFLDLQAGDRLYGRMLEEMASSGAQQPVSGMPRVGFLPPEFPILAVAGPLVEQASAENSRLRPRAEVAIQQVTSVPPWVVDTENALVVEATDTITVKVVVANRGNVPSDETDLELLLEGADGSSVAVSGTVEALEPGTETTVTFADLAVTPGVAYRIQVGLPVAEGEETTNDNLRVIQFRVNEPTPETTTTTSSTASTSP